MKSQWHWLALTIASIVVSHSQAQDAEDYELPPINYSHAQPHDAITHLRTELNSGKVKLQGSDREVVQALLGILHIPVTSQLLVFSKTSFQKDRISPDHPRALYYSDTCYVGWVPGGLVEIAAIDPRLGPVFYSFDPRTPSDQFGHKFRRDNECLRCHGGEFVPGIPGVFARSLYATENGEPLLRQGSEVVDYRTPFTNRWGGWYVSGTHGNTVHRPLKNRIYARLAKALNPQKPEPRFNYIHDSERKRIAAILRETHPEFRKEALNSE